MTLADLLKISLFLAFTMTLFIFLGFVAQNQGLLGTFLIWVLFLIIVPGALVLITKRSRS